MSWTNTKQELIAPKAQVKRPPVRLPARRLFIKQAGAVRGYQRTRVPARIAIPRGVESLPLQSALKPIAAFFAMLFCSRCDLCRAVRMTL